MKQRSVCLKYLVLALITACALAIGHIQARGQENAGSRVSLAHIVDRDSSRLAMAHAPEEATLPGAQTLSLTDVPFDAAVDSLFRTYHLHYRITPDVTVIKEKVTCIVRNGPITDALRALLGSLSPSCQALTFYFERGKYVITPKDRSIARRLSSPPTPGGVDVELTNIPLQAALKQVLDKQRANYFYLGYLQGEQSVTLRGHFDSLEAAVTAIVRSAQPYPMPMYQNQRSGLITLLPILAVDGSTPRPITITCHCSLPFPGVANTIFDAFGPSYRGVESLNYRMLTLNLNQATFQDALKAICAALPDIPVKFDNGMYVFGNQVR